MPLPFNRASMAAWYATQHFKTDPGVQTIYYLQKDAPDREIRFIEVNTLLSAPPDDLLLPIDFGIDTGTESAHQLFVLDVTPSQWGQITSGVVALPSEWSIEDAIAYHRRAI